MPGRNNLNKLINELYALDPEGIVFKEDQDRLLSLKGQYKDLLREEKRIKTDDLSINVGLLGTFSSGKSSILNSLINEDLLPINISPTTAFTTKLRYGFERRSYVVMKNDKRIPITEKQYEVLKNYQTERGTKENEEYLKRHISGIRDVKDIKYVEIELPLPILQKINFYDTPGLESIHEGETDRTREILNELNLVFWIVDINQGSLDQRASKFIKNNLGNLRIPVVLIINKVDTKPPSRWQKIADGINKEYPFDVTFHYSAKKVMEFRRSINTEKLILEAVREYQNDIKKYSDNKDIQKRTRRFIEDIKAINEGMLNKTDNKSPPYKYKWQYEQLRKYIDDIREKVSIYKRKEIERKKKVLIEDKGRFKNDIIRKINILKDRIRNKYKEIEKLKKRSNRRLESVFQNVTGGFRDHVFNRFEEAYFDVYAWPFPIKEVSEKDKERFSQEFKNYINKFVDKALERISSKLFDNESKRDNYDRLIVKLSELDFNNPDFVNNNPQLNLLRERIGYINDFFVESSINAIRAVYDTINAYRQKDFWLECYKKFRNNYEIHWDVVEERLRGIIDHAVSDEKYIELVKNIFSEYFKERRKILTSGYKKAENKIKRLEEVVKNV